MSTELRHEPDNSRYALLIDGQLAAVADYRVNEDAISIHRTFTQPNHRGKGLAAQVVEFAVDDIENNSQRRVVPMCWYVADWFERNPERQGLLNR
jgi:predicted GNAT family acetyltransferase